MISRTLSAVVAGVVIALITRGRAHEVPMLRAKGEYLD